MEYQLKILYILAITVSMFAANISLVYGRLSLKEKHEIEEEFGNNYPGYGAVELNVSQRSMSLFEANEICYACFRGERRVTINMNLLVFVSLIRRYSRQYIRIKYYHAGYEINRLVRAIKCSQEYKYFTYSIDPNCVYAIKKERGDCYYQFDHEECSGPWIVKAPRKKRTAIFPYPYYNRSSRH